MDEEKPATRPGTRVLRWVVAAIAIAMSLYHMHAAAFGPPEALIFRGTHLLFALTLVFLLVVATLLPYSIFSVQASGEGQAISLTVLVALFVCLAPTTIGALLSAIGIAGMNRLSQANVVAMSGRAVEAAGDVDVLLLDKTDAYI